MNHLDLSNDGMELTISDGNGRCTTLRSARPNGFTATDLENARDYQFSKGKVEMNRQQVQR